VAPPTRPAALAPAFEGLPRAAAWRAAWRNQSKALTSWHLSFHHRHFPKTRGDNKNGARGKTLSSGSWSCLGCLHKVIQPFESPCDDTPSYDGKNKHQHGEMFDKDSHLPDNYGRAWHHGFAVHDHRYIVPLVVHTKSWRTRSLHDDT